MATIPVPVHFDGHNINIITEDSPSTRKCWSKSSNYKRKLPQPKIPQCARNEVYIQNLSMPIKSASNKENRDTVDRHESAATTPALTPEPGPNHSKRALFNPRTPGSSENDADSFNLSERDRDRQAVSRTKSHHNDDDMDDTPLTPHKYNPLAEAFTPSMPCALQPPHSVQPTPLNLNFNAQAGSRRTAPMCPRVSRGHGQSGHVGRGQGQPMRKGGPAVTNEQLIKMGFDPAEFGSHDDVGFEDERGAAKDRQSLYKTELCREWSTSGWCYYNKRCSFAHGLHELRPVFRSKKWRTKRCRNWHTTGYCPYEHRCQFLHDQSPPRRMQDYAASVANPSGPSMAGMAGVVETPKQPMYFHYKVDCDRKPTAGKGDDASNDEQATLLNKGTAQNHEGESPVSTDTNEHEPQSQQPPQQPHQALGVGVGVQAKARLVMMSKVGQTQGNLSSQDEQTQGGLANGNKFDHPKYPEMNMAPRQRAQQQREHRQRQSALQRSVERTRTTKKKRAQIKDTVITPFNPIVAPMSVIAPFNPSMGSMSMGIMNPQMSQMSQMAMSVQSQMSHPPSMPPSMGHSLMHSQGLNQPAPSQPSSLFMPPLPPSIDPNVYLNLSPSPGAVPSLSALKAGDESLSDLKQQQLELKLSEQQHKLQQMHHKVRAAAARGQVHHDEAQHRMHNRGGVGGGGNGRGGVSAVDTDLEASPECESIGEDLLHSFLPNDPLIGAENVSSNVDVEAEEEMETKVAKKVGRQDPPLLPPPLLQLQLSQNSIVNSAVNAAMTTPTAAGHKLVPMTGAQSLMTSVSNANSKVNGKGAVSSLMNSVPMTPPSTNTTTHHFHHHYVPSVQMPQMPQMGVGVGQPMHAQVQSVYAQQAHAHAHAYAAAHVNHGAYPSHSQMSSQMGMGMGQPMQPPPMNPYPMSAMSGMSGMNPLGSMPMQMPPMSMSPFGAVPVTPLAVSGGAQGVTPMMPYSMYPASIASSMQSPDLAWQYASKHY